MGSFLLVRTGWIRWSTLTRLAGFFAWLVVGICAAGPVVADPKDDFKAGIASADLGQWQEAVSHFRRAIEGDPRESADQVFLSGVFSRPYLPYFYLGDALVKSGGEADCEQALTAWQESARQGVVQGFRRQWKELEQGRAECLKRVLPILQDRLRQTVTRVESRARGLPRSLPSAALEAQRNNFESELAGARDLSRQADASPDSGAELDLLRRALVKVESAESALAELGSALERYNSVALDSARADAGRAITDAESAREALGDLAGSDPKQGGLEHHFSDLATARQRMADAGDIETLRQIERSAKAAAIDFDRAREELSADLRATPPPPSTGPARTEARASNRETGSDPDRRPAQSLAPSPAPSSSNSRAAEDPRVGAWTDRGRRLLADLGDPPDGRRLLGLQHARLRALLDERDRTADAVEPWLFRIQETMLALRLLAGIEAFLGGEHRRALTLMTSELLTEGLGNGQGEGSSREPIRAQIYLFRAAAGLSLFRLGGEVESDLHRRASEDARRSREIGPDLQPSPDVFSPAFRTFFSAVGSGGG